MGLHQAKTETMLFLMLHVLIQILLTFWYLTLSIFSKNPKVKWHNDLLWFYNHPQIGCCLFVSITFCLVGGVVLWWFLFVNFLKVLHQISRIFSWLCFFIFLFFYFLLSSVSPKEGEIFHQSPEFNIKPKKLLQKKKNSYSNTTTPTINSENSHTHNTNT